LALVQLIDEMGILLRSTCCFLPIPALQIFVCDGIFASHLYFDFSDLIFMPVLNEPDVDVL